MKKTSTTKVAGILVLFAWWLASPNAFAITPHAYEMQGVIQTLDCQKRILTLSSPEGRKPQKLIWKSDTLFIRDSIPASIKELKEGSKVTVYYHSPLFGKPIVSKIVWDGKG